MSTSEALERMQRVQEVASLAGLKGEIDEERPQFRMRFLLPGDRKQGVMVRDSSAKDREVVTLFSVCMTVKKGLVSGMSKEMAVELLKDNERLHFARYGLWELDDEFAVVASVDCLLETLDPGEFHNAAWSVAFAADRFEHEHGQDKF